MPQPWVKYYSWQPAEVCILASFGLLALLLLMDVLRADEITCRFYT